MKKRSLSIILIVAAYILVSLVFSTSVFAEEEVFYGYRALPEENIPFGRIDYFNGDEVPQVFGEDIPSAYPYSDNFNIDRLPEYVPDVRNQNPTGSCWAHTAVGMAEINLAKKGSISNNTANYSEVDLSYFSYHTQVDSLKGTEGDNNSAIYTARYPNCYMVGGNLRFAEHTLAGWVGASDEISHGTSIASLPSNITVIREDNPGGIIKDYMAYDDKAHLIGSFHADITNSQLKNGTINEADKKAMHDEVKRLIMNNGAVGISYWSDNTYYNRTVAAYYYSVATSDTNHAVTIIGWDDNYPRSNFNTEPLGDGAWLVRNSWGPSWSYGKNGYFWLSYYDKSVYSDAISFEYDMADNFDRNYQYDGCMNTTVMAEMPKGSRVANIFTAADTDISHVEKLSAVSFYSSIPTQRVKVEIYKNITDKSNPVSGTCVTSKEETLYYAGFHTIKLDEEIMLYAGTDFSVVFTLLNDSYVNQSTGKTVNNNKFACEKSYSSSTAWYKCVAAKKDNTSFYQMGEGKAWTAPWSRNNDIGNIRIKAFSKLYEYETDDSYEILYSCEDLGYPSKTVVALKDQDVTILGDIFPKKGYTFVGWNTSKDGSGTSYFANQNAGKNLCDLAKGEKTITLYPIYEANKYTITYYPNGGEGEIFSEQITYDEAGYIAENRFSNAFKTFAYFNTEKNGEGSVFFASQEIKNLCTGENGDENIDLYAIWTDDGTCCYIDGIRDEYTYTGDAIIPEFNVYIRNKEGEVKKLISGVDYIFSIRNNRMPLSVASISIIGKNNYAGAINAVKTFRISDDPAKGASTGNISLLQNFKITIKNQANILFDGNKVEPEIIFTVKPGSEGITTPVLHKDYEVAYSNNTNVGKATAYIYAVGEKFCDSKKINFNIKKLNLTKNSSKFSIRISENAALNNKKGAVPDMEIVYLAGDSEYIMSEGKDYSVKFSNNKKITNKGMFVITGKGNFTGKLDSRIGGFIGDKYFKVSKASIENSQDFVICISDINTGDKISSIKYEVYDFYGNKLKTKAVNSTARVFGGSVDVAVKISCNGVVLDPNDRLQKTKVAGKQDEIYVEFAGVNNYSGSVTKKINISQFDVTQSKISRVRFIGQKNHYYNGKPQTLTGDELSVVARNGADISIDKYEMYYFKNIDRGTATVFVKGINGATGYKKIKFKIYPAIWNGFNEF